MKANFGETDNNRSLSEWLAYQETLHNQTIDLGLKRIRQVYRRLFSAPLAFVTITVAGTNGKGSTLAFLESIYVQNGHQVGLLTSPHIFNYNERIRVNQQSVTDVDICQAFATIDKARDKISLTYFEFSTLAALVIFQQQKVAVALLEVGLGGRLDAVNVVNTDCAVITSIDIDHSEYLGDTRAKIAVEKAGIIRADAPLVCMEKNPPKTLLDVIKNHPSAVRLITKPYPHKLQLNGKHQQQNAAGALAVTKLMQQCLPVTAVLTKEALTNTVLSGRGQRLSRGDKTIIFDVAHNEAAVAALADTLTKGINRVAIFAALKDKNIGAMIDKIDTLITQWLLVPLSVERALKTTKMQTFFPLRKAVFCASSVADAMTKALNSDVEEIIVFGSFYTVAEALRVINE